MNELQKQSNINFSDNKETLTNPQTLINASPDAEFHKSENNAVSVVFVTHNRKDLLYKALLAAQQQTLKVDIIVMDDASTDGTDKMIASNFQSITYRRSDKNLGPSHQRNEGAKLAKSEIIFFLDDDTIVQDKNTFEVILNDFSQADFGAVTIPFINVLQNDIVVTGAPSTKKHFLYHAFIAAAFAVRRDIFLQLGGFREEYFYMGEEDDFSIRLLNAGYFVKAGTSQPVHHHQPVGRISYSADFYGRRNDILFYFLNCPRIYFFPFLMLTVVKSIVYGIKVGRPKTMLKGTVSGLKLLFNQNIKKIVKPVSSDVFLKFRKLKLNGPIQL